MAAILLASQCPAVPVFTASVYRNSAIDTTALVGPNIPGTVTWRKQANQNVAMADELARYGAGLIGVPDGPTKITLGVGIGLSLAVSAGHAMIGGPVEIATAGTVTVADNTARQWLWLQQSGVVVATSTVTPPAGEVCLIGSCVTSGGNIASVDYSGVMYLRGGIGWRQTADQSAPTDTPPSTIQFMAYTAGGSYWWDGYTYSRLAGSSASVVLAAAAQESGQNDRLATLERKFRTLLLVLTDTIGEDILITDELQDDVDTASADV